MKKLNDLKAEKTQLTLRYNEIMSVEKMTKELRAEATEIGDKLETLDGDITLAERQEAINARTVAPVETEERTEEAPIGVQFRDFLKNAVDGKGPRSFELRADPIATTTQAGIINKDVANSVDILVSPGEAFLRSLGVTFYSSLSGNFVVPAMAEGTAGFVNEAADASTANMAHDVLTLAARRVSASQAITKETLAQTNPAIYSSIVQNLVNGIWNAVTTDYFAGEGYFSSFSQEGGIGAPVSYSFELVGDASIIFLTTS